MQDDQSFPPTSPDRPAVDDRPGTADGRDVLPVEVGGRNGPEPTRFGDWEKNGRCIDF